MIDTGIVKSYAQAEILDLLLERGFNSGGSFAIWRKPNSHKLEVVMNKRDEVEKVPLNLEELTAGFIAHPFADQQDKQAFFISASDYISFNLGDVISADELPQWINTGIKNGYPQKSTIRKSLFIKSPKRRDGPAGDSCKQHFMHLVKLGINEISAGKLEKVVPSRAQTLHLDESFDLGSSLLSMLRAYPNSFVNFFHIPTVGTWLGASPEVLIETKGDHFYTMSLAGTQPAAGENPLKSAAWTQKEIEEQALVSRYIVECFKKIRLRDYEEHGPKTVMAGTLLHLKSDFRVNMKTTNFPQLGSVMLELLHPTSAVCGMPRKEAHEFLQRFEGFDRSFFAGFLGPVNISGETSLYVNLRTASFQGNYAVLYAGAGVTEDSDPEKEWEETELKCQIIGKFIQNPNS